MTLLSASSRSSVDGAHVRCSGGHGFDWCQGLGIFLCLMLVSCWSGNFSQVSFCCTNELESHLQARDQYSYQEMIPTLFHYACMQLQFSLLQMCPKYQAWQWRDCQNTIFFLHNTPNQNQVYMWSRKQITFLSWWQVLGEMRFPTTAWNFNIIWLNL